MQVGGTAWHVEQEGGVYQYSVIKVIKRLRKGVVFHSFQLLLGGERSLRWVVDGDDGASPGVIQKIAFENLSFRGHQQGGGTLAITTTQDGSLTTTLLPIIKQDFGTVGLVSH